MVSKTIEGAQSRVEGFNFDTRKHVVEYDDVINRQRETIYHERERILRAHDLAPTLLGMLEDEVRGLVDEHTVGDFGGDWNREGLTVRIATMVPALGPAELAIIDEAEESVQIADALVDLVAAAYERKRAEIGDAATLVLERVVLLRVIDSLWVEHLTAIDDMRRGIGLRAYSQRDPLNEFKVEAYRMFDELKTTIRNDVTHTIFRVTVTREPTGPRPRQMREGLLDLAQGGAVIAASGADGAGGSSSGAAGQARGGPKIGRNDPCYCGSGKKFKRCHGA
ncbi:MAG: SEC-C metal-binding domain-containing protein [Gemmatimonadota bacterium]|nr:SEC-C metal-binding domain-containing protein [Gemmatimonadota bacterium]